MDSGREVGEDGAIMKAATARSGSTIANTRCRLAKGRENPAAKRAGATVAPRRKPGFQFPQDENPQLARDGWAPRLWDYFYLSLTNATAFSPTDAMPLTRTAKSLMAAESVLSLVTVLLVAARVANILT